MASDEASTTSDTFHLTEDTPTDNIQFLPSQKDYFQDLNLLASTFEPVILKDSEVTCGICLESLAEIVSPCIADTSCFNQVIVALPTCKHLFHYCCVTKWHRSARPERNTCPNCRREMFIADPLTQEQIQQLAQATSPTRMEIMSNLATNEMLIPWDTTVLDMYARQGVSQTIAMARTSRLSRRVSDHNWISLCHLIRELLLSTGDVVRPVLQTHGYDFINVVIGAAVLCRILRYSSATRMSAFRRLVDWVDQLIDTIGEVEFQSLYGNFRSNGLFQIDRFCVLAVNDGYVRFYLRMAADIRLVSAGMKERVRESRWKGALGRIKQCATRNLKSGHAHRTSKTLATVLGRIPNGGLLHCLSHTPGQPSNGTGVFGIAWDDVLMVGNEPASNAPHVI